MVYFKELRKHENRTSWSNKKRLGFHIKFKKFILRDIPIISLEEHNIIGGLGSALSEVIADTGIAVKFLRLGINDKFSHFVGSHNYQKEMSNLVEKPKLQWFNSKQK